MKKSLREQEGHKKAPLSPFLSLEYKYEERSKSSSQGTMEQEAGEEGQEKGRDAMGYCQLSLWM